MESTEELWGSDAAWLGRDLGVHRPFVEQGEVEDARAEVLDDLPTLAGRLDLDRASREHLLDRVGELRTVQRRGREAVLDAGDRLLERRRARDELHRLVDDDALRKRGVE